jgi:coatomer protein complex subunit epsilon
MADLLFQLRNSFWVGNFDDAISEAAAMSSVPNNVEIERDFYRMRAEIECSSSVKTKSVDQSLPSALQAVQLLAAHRSGSASEEKVTQTLDAWMDDENTGENPLLQIIAATLYNRLGDWNKALTVLRSEATLEQ